MNSFKTFSLSLLSTLSMGHAFANETSSGIGAAIDNELTIYFPVKTTNYLIESSILIFSRTEKRTDTSTSQKDELEVKEIAIGIFKNTTVYDKIFIYYGARAGYTEKNP